MIDTIRQSPKNIIVAGSHSPIIQSILDFDYISGRETPSIVAIISDTKAIHKGFFGPQEMIVPVYASIRAAKAARIEADFILNATSAHNAKRITEEFFTEYPNGLGGHIFAEGVPEHDAVSLIATLSDKHVAGPSGVGLLVPGHLKLGALGGITGDTLADLARYQGSTAIVCSSGGMVNELISTLRHLGGAPSFAVSYGGDRFPITTPLQWCLAAENDPHTKTIVFFGELGGTDEYEIAQALAAGTLTKPLLVYIAGHYQSQERTIQFGHAKALVQSPEETASAKMDSLAKAGARVCATYESFVTSIRSIHHIQTPTLHHRDWNPPPTPRTPTLFTAVRDHGNSKQSFIAHVLSTLLEKDTISEKTVQFTEMAFSTLVDHGAEPSGALNTMVTARAGRDMASSVAAGILTIGNRFGGAINNAAKNWFTCVRSNITVESMLDAFKKQQQPVPGIGHKKYTTYHNDPRVESLKNFAMAHLTHTPHVLFATETANRTTEKKPNLILNVDGIVAAILLDLLLEEERLTKQEIEQLLETEFFNSYFIIPRTAGFIGHYLSQKRRDEGLFRLPTELIHYL